jgi:N-acetylglucosaminyl-diphospho-decaprenol L-rhamnosyltransferase
MDQAFPPAIKSLVTLSIVSHGDAEKVALLLESLHSCEQNSQFRVILTDNLGNDLPAIDNPAGVSITILRNQRPRGFASNHNQAFRLAETKYFCILNPDVLFEQAVFRRLIALLETDKADIVAPLIVDPGAVVQDSFRVLPTPLNIVRRKLPGYRFVPIPADADGLARPDWMAGIFLLLKSESYKKLGGFDERYRFYFEDVDLCTRARLAGLKLLVDTGIQVQHSARHASRKNFRYLLWHIQSAIRFFSSPVFTQALRNKP